MTAFAREFHGPGMIEAPKVKEAIHVGRGFRLYLLRFGYLLTIVLVGANAWPALINHQGPWDPLVGAGWCLYAAMSALAVVGMRYPLKMLPVLFHQMLYKAIWLVAIGIVRFSGGRRIRARVFCACRKEASLWTGFH